MCMNAHTAFDYKKNYENGNFMNITVKLWWIPPSDTATDFEILHLSDLCLSRLKTDASQSK